MSKKKLIYYFQFYFLHLGAVTNVDRQNKTTMLYHVTGGTVPKGTVSVKIQLMFIRRVDDNRLRFGMADNLKLIIQQK